MPVFDYNARNQQGEKVSGTEEAESSDVLLTRLQMRGLFVTSVKQQTQAAVTKAGDKAKAKIVAQRANKMTHSGVKEEDLTLFARQLATILGSGVPLLKSLNAILRQVDSKKFYDMVTKISSDVEAGFSFRDAMAKYPKIFTPLWVNLVETGEASGNLPLVLERLANYLETRAAFKRKIISAMVYPIILFSVAALAIIIFVLIIIPKFTDIFKGFDIELPLPTRILIAISGFARKNIMYLVFAIIAAVFAFKRIVRNKQGKRLVDSFVFKIPILSDYLHLAETEKFTSTMATLLESGVPILYALEIAERSVDNVLVQAIIKNVNDNVREGRSLVQPLEEGGFFSPMVIQMVSIGEEIGELDKMFKRIAAFYSELMEVKITRFTAMFEPLMIVFMGIVIGGMVISMFLPIFQIANIGGK